MSNVSELKLGFTIVELLVSISVVLIIVSLTLANYSAADRRQKLISAGQTMKNIIRDAQSRAYNGEADCTVCDCTLVVSSSLTGWYVDFDNKTIYGDCQGATFSSISFQLGDEIVITPYITPPTKLLFQNSPPSPQQKATICVGSNNLSGKYYKVMVNLYGDVSDSEGLVDVCTP